MYRGHHSQVLDKRFWSRVKFDRTDDPGIVEKVKVGIVLFFQGNFRVGGNHTAELPGRFASDREGTVVDPVINHDSQQIGTIPDHPANFHLEWQKSSFVGDHQVAVQVYLCMMGHRTKPKYQPFLREQGRNRKFCLVKRQSIMVSEGFSFLLIVVGSGNGDGITVFQSTGLPPLFDTGPVIQPEPPDAAKINHCPGIVEDWIQHEKHSFSNH